MRRIVALTRGQGEGWWMAVRGTPATFAAICEMMVGSSCTEYRPHPPLGHPPTDCPQCGFSLRVCLLACSTPGECGLLARPSLDPCPSWGAKQHRWTGPERKRFFQSLSGRRRGTDCCVSFLQGCPHPVAPHLHCTPASQLWPVVCTRQPVEPPCILLIGSVSV